MTGGWTCWRQSWRENGPFMLCSGSSWDSGFGCREGTALDMLIWKCVSTDRSGRGTVFPRRIPMRQRPDSLRSRQIPFSNLFPGNGTEAPLLTTRCFSVLWRKWLSVLLLNVNSDLLLSGQALGCFFYNQNLIHRTGFMEEKIWWFC